MQLDVKELMNFQRPLPLEASICLSSEKKIGE